MMNAEKEKQTRDASKRDASKRDASKRDASKRDASKRIECCAFIFNFNSSQELRCCTLSLAVHLVVLYCWYTNLPTTCQQPANNLLAHIHKVCHTP